MLWRRSSTPPPSVSSCLLLSASLRIHPTFHVSPSSSHSLLVSFARPPTPLLPPPQLIDGHPAYSVKEAYASPKE
ncbi:hypothetical protein L3Q82_005324 [Scortum barcoo]|uniref:Uncharacterized protein n=1 Tax=Scortum barcoo TaxID=214431 RepID=A0ACB8VCU9_9TELE|nr:hypothetical protein L3Q82_005324 [Scortum barcoo]